MVSHFPVPSLDDNNIDLWHFTAGDGKIGNIFYSVLSCCQDLGFTLEEQDVIFRIISSILHLGNVYFHRKQLKHGEQTSGFGPLIYVSSLVTKKAEFPGYSL